MGVYCFAVYANVSRGKIHARTFNFTSPSGATNDSIEDAQGVVHTAVQSAITKNLSARGVNRVASGGDVAVAYLIIDGDNVSAEAIRGYFAEKNESGDRNTKVHQVSNARTTPDRFEAGTLLIDIADGRSTKLLKRGHTSRPIALNPTDSVNANRVQAGVDEILKEVRIVR